MIKSSKQTLSNKKSENPKISQVLKDLDTIASKQTDQITNLRPQTLADYIGQNRLKKQLELILKSSVIRNVLPEHLLFYGQPGLGKTTLANLISTEVGAKFKVVAAPSLQRVGDLVSLLLNLEDRTVLFIDEIHRLRAPLEETLYTAMEDQKIDLVMGKGHGAVSTRMDLPAMTLVGATTQLGKLSKPLKDRFPTIFNIEPYSSAEILDLIDRNIGLLKLKMSKEAKEYLAQRCRGVPRVTNNLLKRLLDYQVVHNLKEVDLRTTTDFLAEIGIHKLGLTKSDIKYLEAVKESALGLKTLSGILLEETDTLEQVTEPYLIHLGFVNKSSTGRLITPKGREYLESVVSNTHWT